MGKTIAELSTRHLVTRINNRLDTLNDLVDEIKRRGADVHVNYHNSLSTKYRPIALCIDLPKAKQETKE